MLTGLHTMIAEVSDMARASAFYRDVLGLTPEYESLHWSSYRIGNDRIGLHPPFATSTPGSVGGWVLGIATTDIKTLRLHLDEAGVECGAFHVVPGGVVMDFKDPDGNRIQAIELGASVEVAA